MARILQSTVFLLFLHLISASLHINLDLTDRVSANENPTALQYHCLHVPVIAIEKFHLRQLLSYCLTEPQPKWNITSDGRDRYFTFAQLSEQAVTSEQLYLWSAPLDLIERYQLYLNQRSAEMNEDVFYNCTLPRFGPRCQYSLDIEHANDVSLTTIVQSFYLQKTPLRSITCYLHLECDLGSTSICLDWADICDGYVDCLNDQADERHCWQMEVDVCAENEHRCKNGQCIPLELATDDGFATDCLDLSDRKGSATMELDSLDIEEPSFYFEDKQCPRAFHQLTVQPTSSCSFARLAFLTQVQLLVSSKTETNECQATLQCHLRQFDQFFGSYGESVWNIALSLPTDEPCPPLRQISIACTPSPLVKTSVMLFGHIYFAYDTHRLLNAHRLPIPHYICYNERLCGGFSPNRTLISTNGTACRRLADFPLFLDADFMGHPFAEQVHKQLQRCHTIAYDDMRACQHPMMYRCTNSSKCIWMTQLCNDLADCDHGDDEQCALVDGRCPFGESSLFFKCTATPKCISIESVNNNKCDCGFDRSGFCADDPEASQVSFAGKLLFVDICDGFTSLPLVDGRNDTDESDCEHWQCDNIYTRCDHIWNCRDGADEANCFPTLSSQCPPSHHPCVSPLTYRLMCLPFAHANDGHIDCLGGTDEPSLCQIEQQPLSTEYFHCRNDSDRSCIRGRWCSRTEQCAGGEEQSLCNETRHLDDTTEICHSKYDDRRSPEHEFFCQRYEEVSRLRRPIFLLDNMDFPREQPFENDDSALIEQMTDFSARCHRGLRLLVWSDSENNQSQPACLCPPSYYGDSCQYQNQRVSFTVQLRAYSDSRRTLFTVLVSLVDLDDDERRMISYQQHTYLYLHHCSIKYNTYLLYPTRPKDPSRNYSIHVDVYEKISLAYRGSFFVPVRFTFMPVDRIVVQLNIPGKSQGQAACVNLSCVHGRCVRYVNDRLSRHFCQCEPGWYGKSCQLPHRCQCASDSLCVGVSATNQSVCACRVNRWGPRCLLEYDACHASTEQKCLNGGRCVPDEQQLVRSDKYMCICPSGYDGPRCENTIKELRLSFDDAIELPHSVLAHFFRASTWRQEPVSNGSTIRMISTHENVVIIHWPHEFHIALAQLRYEFYLILIQSQYNATSTLTRTIHSNDRCRKLEEVLDNTIVQMPLLRRMKYYQIPCQKYSPDLKCFYDTNYLCLCYDYNNQRLANCFEFNGSARWTCFGSNACENGAECVQDTLSCPKRTLCVCPRCYHGTRCQFNSHSLGLSLDAILGYHIQPHIAVSDQSSAVQTTLALTIALTVVGLINGVLSSITFKNKEPRKSGCGQYLLASSITTLFTMSILACKSAILIATQIYATSNRPFLAAQCHTVDYLLRSGVNADQYLNACVACERAWTVMRGVNFDKNACRRMAKRVIISVLLWSALTTIHDPIHRRLVDDHNEDDDEQEKRIWCVVSYPTHVRIYNYIINLVHIFVPFAINVVAALIIIVVTTRRRHHLQSQQTSRKILAEQLRAHRHLLIAPILLVILALPRLILSFMSDCMSSTGDIWLPLTGYFVSFIPPALTMIIFVLPSELYRKEFRNSLKQLHKTIRKSFRGQQD